MLTSNPNRPDELGSTNSPNIIASSSKELSSPLPVNSAEQLNRSREDKNPRGLTQEEVFERRARGFGNDVKLPSSRTYLNLLKDNVFTFLNAVPFTIGLLLLWLGQFTDAVTSIWVISFNTLVGLIQEVRAKRKLDRISLMTRPKAAVLREGTVYNLDPAEIVVDDVLVLSPGDQVVVDGQVLTSSSLSVDESLLTGESDLVQKHVGEPVLSGSFCAAGSGMYRAQKVGLESFANTLASNARLFQRVLTPLQSELYQVVRLVVMIAGFFGVLLAVSALVDHLPLVQTMQMAAVIAALVPNGLFMMITLAYALGAVRIARRGALIQQANAVESLSNVEVLCLDKTGTLTANRLEVAGIYPIGPGEGKFKQVLGTFVASSTGRNRTSQTLLDSFGGLAEPVVEEVVFSSAYKWSALTFERANLAGTYVLGAPEILAPATVLDKAAQETITGWQNRGLRVLIFGSCPAREGLHDQTGQPRLPAKLTTLGLVALSDVLRTQVGKTIQSFAQAGVTLKIISGDNPQTVQALARQAGMEPGTHSLTGSEVDLMSDQELALAARETTIFGRITPKQKERLVVALQAGGHYVAMIGDGVNDVLSLKKANLGIAMESGSQASRAVSGIILLGDSFESLPEALKEGQRIRNGMQDNLKLHLPRIGFEAILIISMAVASLGFPFLPRQSSTMVFLTVGLPVVGLTVWAQPGQTGKRSLLRTVQSFIIPAILSRVILGLVVFLTYFFLYLWTLKAQNPTLPENALEAQAFPAARTALFLAAVLSGLLLIPFVKPPAHFWVGGEKLSSDKRPAWLALVIMVFFGMALALPAFQEFLGLVTLKPWEYLLLVGLVALWSWLVRTGWRRNWLEKVFNIKRT
mgnify:CR=1 FL=1